MDHKFIHDKERNIFFIRLVDDISAEDCNLKKEFYKGNYLKPKKILIDITRTKRKARKTKSTKTSNEIATSTLPFSSETKVTLIDPTLCYVAGT